MHHHGIGERSAKWESKSPTPRPPGGGGLRLEDPRLPLMMAAPPRLADAPPFARTFVTLTPEPGTLYMWESWLRHEVLPSRAKTPRVSLSFNYAWR